MKLVAFLLALTLGTSSQAPTKIAIIGGGIGGTSAAHFLRKALPDAAISIYEPNHVGGRLKTVKLAGEVYECGGTIIHPANQMMVSLVQQMGLQPREPGPDSRITILSKDGVVFQQSDWSFLHIFQFIYRYGLFTMLKLHFYIQNMLSHFAQIYPYLTTEGKSFDTVEEMLTIMSPSSKKNKSNEAGMLDLLGLSLSEELLRQNMGQEFIDELVTAAVRTNYGQMPGSVHAFVGSVALAGAEGDLWSIDGGNHLLPEKLLESSKASLIQSKVAEVIKRIEDTYQILTTDGETSSYDVVILALPMTSDTQSLKIRGLELPEFEGRYHKTVANLVHGDINPAYMADSSEGSLTNTNFIVDETKNINSIALLAPVNYRATMELPSVWKVFSQEPLSEDELRGLFLNRNEVVTCDWLAYPHYSIINSTMTPFKLSENLYHINAIEWSASAMEMSVIGALNVANMVANHRLQDEGTNPTLHSTLHSKQEL